MSVLQYCFYFCFEEEKAELIVHLVSIELMPRRD